MNKEHEEEITPQEREAFGRLAKEKMPSPFLEERIVEALKQSNLIRAPKTGLWASFQKPGIAIAASLALFILGALAGLWWASTPSGEAGMPEFMLLLRAAPQESQAGTSDEVLRRVEEYDGWAKEIQKRGLLLGGEKLKDEARLLSVINGRNAVSLNQPASENNAIAGYFLIHAHDYEHAITIAEGCPHLKYGGIVEVRQIERF